jgi:hypothetical protein
MAITGENKQRSYAGDYMDEGIKAQNIVLKFLRDHPDVIGVDDMSQLKVMQEADVDCMIKTRDGLITLAEIKSDKWIGKSENILFEVLRINHTAPPDHCVTLGWSARTPAKYLIYYSPELERIYVIASDDLRRAMQKYTSETRKSSNISYVSTDNIKSTINILIPERYCKFKVYDLVQEEVPW